MTVRRIFTLVFILFFTINTNGQLFQPKNYPQRYFSWPVVARKGLAANFGELRSNHYHMGLDCRTDQAVNKPVLASADGYIARVKIEPFGFGRCIYINHPNGLTTLYAHLNDFSPQIEAYVTEQQYKLQSWKIDIELPFGLISVKKGQLIAYSGNTGGSQGPHTHFEIRDTQTEKVLNPLLFDMGISDNIPPDLLRLAVYDRCVSTYEQSPRLYPVRKAGSEYTTTPGRIVAQTERVSFAITAYDRYTGSTNKNGIYQAVIYDNDQAITGFRLDNIGYDETRYLNAHIDYKLRSNGGSYVQHLSRLPGYPEGVYTAFSGDGVINIEDDLEHRIRIEVMDANGNMSRLNFKIQRAPGSAPKTKAMHASFYQQNEFHPGFLNIFENDQVSLYLPENALYDSIRFRYKEIIPATGLPIYQLHDGNIPVHGPFPVRIKNRTATHPDKMVMHYSWKTRDDYKKAVPVKVGEESGWYEASFRAFGNFQLLEDTEPPSITPIGFRNGINTASLRRITFVIKDNTEELENFNAWLDGQWLRFSNDKGRTFIYEFDEHCPRGKHELKIRVEDCVGNLAERTYEFTR